MARDEQVATLHAPLRDRATAAGNAMIKTPCALTGTSGVFSITKPGTWPGFEICRGGRNRTLVSGFGDPNSTTEILPHRQHTPIKRMLLCFFVQLVLFASFAKLLQFQTLFNFTLVFECVITDSLALSALQFGQSIL